MSGEGGPMPDRPMVSAAQLVDDAMFDAPKVLIAAQIALPLATLMELRRALQGPALRSVLDARVALHQAGHDEETDDMLPIGWLPFEARKKFHRAQEAMNDGPEDLDAVRQMMVDGIAMMLAGVDRLDRAMKRKLV